MATGGGWDAGVSPEDFSKDVACKHGLSECECLDNLTTRQAGTMSFTVIPSSSTSVPIMYPGGTGGQWNPAFAPLVATPTSFAPVATPATGCILNGHRVVHAPIVSDEGVRTGICEDCYQTIRFDTYEPAFDFEQAGILLGRAIGIDIEDPDDVGEILSQLIALRSEIGRHMKRYEAALDLLDLATGIVKKRALHDTATAVDAA